MKSLFSALLLLAAAPLAGCNEPVGEAPLAGARIGGPFALTDQHGKTVRDTDFAGRYRIVYFGYTYCPDICPTDLSKISQALRSLDGKGSGVGDKVVPIFISVDPERDNPAALKSFAANFDRRLVALTGSMDAITRVTKDYAVAFAKQPTPSGYLVGHTEVAYLMSPQGKPITTLPLEKGAPAIAAELRHWVR